MAETTKPSTDGDREAADRLQAHAMGDHIKGYEDRLCPRCAERREKAIAALIEAAKAVYRQPGPDQSSYGGPWMRLRWAIEALNA